MIKKDEVIKIGVFNKPHGVKGELSFTFISLRNIRQLQMVATLMRIPWL